MAMPISCIAFLNTQFLTVDNPDLKIVLIANDVAPCMVDWLVTWVN